ncbi:MAG: hypothetical protein KAX20_06365 [Candidatus Omnitrophica bacterium]|nr:hypothetical protein [Candidatus Omnitrophota bacterium]
MLKRKVVLLAVAGILVIGSGLKAAQIEMSEEEKSDTELYHYTQGFEETDPVKFWCSNGEYTVNFKGLTEEKVHSGKKSFKLDVTFEKGSYFYWQIPLPKRIPVIGKDPINFSGHLLIGEETTNCKAGLGRIIYFSPIGHGGNRVISKYGEAYRTTNGKWKLFSGDLVKLTSAPALAKRIWGAGGDNISGYVPGIYLHLRGRGRAVIYVDDIKIEGQVPTEEAFKEETIRRWAPVKERMERKLTYWENSLREISKNLNSVEDEEKKKELEKKVSSFVAQVAGIRKKGYILKGEEESKISSFIKATKEELSSQNQIF